MGKRRGRKPENATTHEPASTPLDPKWVIATLVALLAAGGGIVTLLKFTDKDRACKESDAACLQQAHDNWANIKYAQGGAEKTARALNISCSDHGNNCSCAGLGFVYSNKGLFPDAPEHCSYFRSASVKDQNWWNSCKHDVFWDRFVVDACSVR